MQRFGTVTSLVASLFLCSSGVHALHAVNGTALVLRGSLNSTVVESKALLDASKWYEAFGYQPHWHKYSQFDQDSVLASLFKTLHTTNKYFVEFGFDADGYYIGGGGANTNLLYDQGWHGLLMDGAHSNPSYNLHREWITPENIVGLFQKYKVPLEPDYVSIDVDSCDLQLFMAITEHFKPRVLTVEYNSNWKLEESKANRCRTESGEAYSWTGDDLYGVSVSALHKAAGQRGYTMVYAEKPVDMFLVRSDLVIQGTEVPLETFRPATGVKMHKTAGAAERAKWIIDY